MNTESLVQRPTIAEINLDHLTHNFREIQRHVPSKVMAIIKANAYGHGLVSVAKHFTKLGVDQLGVAFVEEGVALRKAGIKIPILILGGILEEQISHFLSFDLEITVSSLYKLRQVEEVSEQLKKRAVIHLKIDTGMERVGVHSYSARPLIEAAVCSKWCELKGVYSHLACSDNPSSPLTKVQVERFYEALSIFDKIGAPMPMRHLANSGGILHFPETHFDIVRPGIILYGVFPDPAARRDILDLKPVLSLKSKVVYFKVTKKGRSISYGATWTAEKDTRIATIPIGYGDGYARAMSNKGDVLIRKKHFPIVGRVCMDQFMVNIGEDSAYVGDEVILIGKMGDNQISVEQFAEKIGTIPYEVLTGLNDRLPRVYVD